ncbi:unnamed protein product [Effrenium voratum]|nr:unnamed protein product [Effrenium voratum]
MTGRKHRPKFSAAQSICLRRVWLQFPPSVLRNPFVRGEALSQAVETKPPCRGFVRSVLFVPVLLRCQSAACGHTRESLIAFLPVLVFLALATYPPAQGFVAAPT